MKLLKNSINLIMVAIIAFQACDTPNEDSVLLSEADKKEIETLARDIPLILSNQGWDAYEEKFAQGYRNWSMTGDNVRSREAYLGLVKDWYDAGNRATGSEIETIGFVPISKDMTLYLNAQKEVFRNPEDTSTTLTRDIRFVSVYKKEGGEWKNYFTAFMDKPQ